MASIPRIPISAEYYIASVAVRMFHDRSSHHRWNIDEGRKVMFRSSSGGFLATGAFDKQDSEYYYGSTVQLSDIII